MGARRGRKKRKKKNEQKKVSLGLAGELLKEIKKPFGESQDTF